MREGTPEVSFEKQKYIPLPPPRYLSAAYPTAAVAVAAVVVASPTSVVVAAVESLPVDHPGKGRKWR